MDKNILKEKLAEVKSQLRTNAKDVHFFDKLIDEALCLKGQLSIEPIALDCGQEIDEMKGDTFRLTLTDKGIIYKEFGGYSVFAPRKDHAMYDVLEDIVKNKEKFKEGDEYYEALMQIIAYNLSIPRISFLDIDFAKENAERTIHFIQKMYDELTQQELQKEDVDKDEQFKEVVSILEAISKE